MVERSGKELAAEVNETKVIAWVWGAGRGAARLQATQEVVNGKGTSLGVGSVEKG